MEIRKCGFHHFVKQVTLTLFSVITYKKIQTCNFFTLDDYIGLESDHICKLTENLFSKDFRTRTLDLNINLLSTTGPLTTFLIG